MHGLPGDAERSLLAALLVDEREWTDTAPQIEELARRFDIRQRKKTLRRVTQSIADHQATGEPAPTRLEAELTHLQQAAQAVRDLMAPREPGEPGPAPGTRP